MKFRLLAAVLALGSPSGAALADAGTLSGEVRVPSGHDVNGAVVIACTVLPSGDCDMETAAFSQFAFGRGERRAFELAGAPAGKLRLFGWKDVDGSGAIDAGDLVGLLTEDGATESFVRAPMRGIVLQLVEFDVAPDAPAIPGGDSGDIAVIAGAWVQGSFFGPSGEPAIPHFDAAAGRWNYKASASAVLIVEPDGRYAYSSHGGWSSSRGAMESYRKEYHAGRASLVGAALHFEPETYRRIEGNQITGMSEEATTPDRPLDFTDLKMTTNPDGAPMLEATHSSGETFYFYR